MTYVLWILNALLAMVFVTAGITKVLQSREELSQSGASWALEFRGPTIKVIGALELAGGIALVVPLLLGVGPLLTPFAALGLAAVMLAAGVVRARRQGRVTPYLALATLLLVSAFLSFEVVLSRR